MLLYYAAIVAMHLIAADTLQRISSPMPRCRYAA